MATRVRLQRRVPVRYAPVSEKTHPIGMGRVGKGAFRAGRGVEKTPNDKPPAPNVNLYAERTYGKMPLPHVLEDLGRAILRAQDDASKLAEIRATLLCNFGPTSLSLKRYGFQIDTEGPDNKDDTIRILLFVLEKLITRNGDKPPLNM